MLAVKGSRRMRFALLATGLLVSEPALAAEAPAPVDGAMCCDSRARASVLGSRGEDVGSQLQFPFSLHSELLPRSPTVQPTCLLICSTVLSTQTEILWSSNPADAHVELYIIYIVRFSLISSWDPALIIAVLFVLFIISWFEQEVALELEYPNTD